MKRHANRARLDSYVAACIAAAPDAADPAAFLRLNAAHAERQLRALSAWAGSGERPCPDHLQGLTAFDLSDAMDRLAAEAERAAA